MLAEVFDQRAGRLVDVAALIADVAGQRAVLVPTAMEELNTLHVALGQPGCSRPV